MSLVERESTPARVAASQANGKKSKGPATPEGKARASLNSLKTGAYARTDKVLREIMLRRGENPEDFEQLHQEFAEEWEPGYVTEATLVKTIAEKTFDKAQLRAGWMESQLNSLRIAEVQAKGQQLVSRRWLPGVPNLERGEQPPLWLAKDSPSKFHTIFQILDDLQKWYDHRVIPDTFAQDMHTLYGAYHSRAGERIRTLFIEMYEPDKQAAAKAEVELPKWIAQERRDVEQERELYRQEQELKAKRPSLSEEEVAKKEAALERQIRDQTRLLLQLKKARSQWPVGSSGARPDGAQATPSQVPEASTGANKSEGNTDGVPPAKPVRSRAAGPSVSLGVSSGVSSGGDSTTQEDEGAA